MLFVSEEEKNEARKRQWQMAMNQWEVGTKTKKREPKHHDVLCSKHFEKMLHRSHPAEHSFWAQIHVHSETDFEKNPV